MNRAHRPALWLSIALGFGICAGKFIVVPFWVWGILSMISVLAFWARQNTVLIYVLMIVMGALMISQRQLLPADSIGLLNEEEFSSIQAVEGLIESDAEQKQGGIIYALRVQRLLINDQWQRASGGLRLTCYGNQEELFEYGQLVDVQGRLRPFAEGNGKNGFSYRRYMQGKGVYGNLNVKDQGIKLIAAGRGNFFLSWVFKLHRWMNEILTRYLSRREAAFVAALVIGDRQQMPPDLKEIFVNTGTAHILAISGMNMAVVTAVFFFLLRLCFVSRQVHFWGTISFLFAYAYLSGWSASVVRASIMSALILASFVLEYESDALNALGLAAMILLVMDPANLFDVGFQLSFAAVLGILILFKSCKTIFVVCPGFIADSMALSLSAWAGTVGIMLYHFHLLTPISIVANIPIVPMADLVMVLGLGLVSTGGWCPILAAAFAGCLKAVLSAMIICAQWFNQIPWGHFTWT